MAINPAYISRIKDNSILPSSRGVERRSDLLDIDDIRRLPRSAIRDLRLCRSFLSPRNDNIITFNHRRSNNRLYLLIGLFLILVRCTQPPVLDLDPSVIRFSQDGKTATLSLPTSSIQSIPMELTTGYLPNIVMDSLLSIISDSELNQAVRQSLISDPQAWYPLDKLNRDRRIVTATYKLNIDRFNHYLRQSLVHTDLTQPILPLFASGEKLPPPGLYSHLQLLPPVKDIPFPEKESFLPNANRHYRFGIHRGIDFQANWGTEIQAVADGVIIRSDLVYQEVSPEFYQNLLTRTKRLKRTPYDIFEHILLGKTLIIDHGFDLVEGYRLISIYAHLSYINTGLVPGTHVIAGQILGKTGNTGSLKNTMGERNGAHLHWELILQDTEGEYYLGQGVPYPDILGLKKIFNR